MQASQPPNPLYVLLLVVCVMFVITALAYTVVPVLEEKAIEAGDMPPPSPFRDDLRNNGWKWLLVQAGLIILFGLASMGLDHYRRLQKERDSATISEDKKPPA